MGSAVSNCVHMLDLQAGNIASVEKAVRRVGWSVRVCSRFEDLHGAKKVIIPGVGNFGFVMSQIDVLGGKNSLLDVIHQSGPDVLGICVGMQIMCSHSEEADCDGLDVIDGVVKKFTREGTSQVPNIGWRDVGVCANNPLMQETSRFYFVHSYYVHVNEKSTEILVSQNGHEFCAGFSSGRFFGVQFHPEKSHDDGLALIRNFLNYVHE